MKIIHTSDWHLGRLIYGCSLIGDQEYFIKEIFLPYVINEQPQLVVIAGDIFDRQIAPVEAIRLFNCALGVLYERGIKIAVIAGNHDGGDRLAAYSGLLRGSGLYISARPFDTPPLYLEDKYGGVDVHFLPYFDTATARDILNDDSIRGAEEAYKAMINEIKKGFKAGRKNILIAHCFVAGSSVCESESPSFIGGSGEVGASVFEGFDYVALGHLHGPQQPSKTVFYSGSPLKYSFDEEKQKKSMIVADFNDNKVDIKRLPIKSMRDMRTITGTLDELILASKSDKNSDDYLYAMLTNERPIYEPMAQLREYYPNILGLHPGWLTTSGNGGARDELREKLRSKTAGDSMFFEEFLKQVCGITPGPKEIAVFEEVMAYISAEGGNI